MTLQYQSLERIGFPGGTSGKEPACQCRRHKRYDFDPWVGKIPWRRKWQPTPVFLPGKSYRQRSLVGYSPWGLKESDTTEWHTQREQKNNSSSIIDPNLFLILDSLEKLLIVTDSLASQFATRKYTYILRFVVKYRKTSTKFLSYMSVKFQGILRFFCAVNNLKSSLNEQNLVTLQWNLL